MLNGYARLEGGNLFKGHQTVWGGVGLISTNPDMPAYYNGLTAQNYSPVGNAIRAEGTIGGISAEASATAGPSFGVSGVVHSPVGLGVQAVNDADGVPGQMKGYRPVALVASTVKDEPSNPGNKVGTDYSVAIHAWAPGQDGIGIMVEGGGGDGAAGEFNNPFGGVLVRGFGPCPSVGPCFEIRGDGSATFIGSVSAANVQPQGADFAESMDVAGLKTEYEPGDVLAIDPASDRRLVKASGAYNGSVAGIYATKPGILASPHPAGDPSLADDVPLAIVGIVPCKVTAANGAIARGDLLVVSEVAGYAMKGTDRSRLVGAVVGKALQPLATGTGTILVLVTLQ